MVKARGEWWQRFRCWMRRYSGKIAHDDEGIYWQCRNCGVRVTVPWDEVAEAAAKRDLARIKRMTRTR